MDTTSDSGVFEGVASRRHHFHCGPDCYREHRSRGARCAWVGHYDGFVVCVEDCAEFVKAKREGLML